MRRVQEEEEIMGDRDQASAMALTCADEGTVVSYVTTDPSPEMGDRDQVISSILSAIESGLSAIESICEEKSEIEAVPSAELESNRRVA